MAAALQGRRVAFLVANEGVEQIELTSPWQAVEQEGATPVLIAPKPGTIRAFNHLDKGATFPVHQTVDESAAADFVGLVLPGGVANPDQLRTVPAAVAFIRDFVEAGKPVAVICHGPWTLVEADVVRGKRLTSWPSLRTDIRNAGGEWVDEQVVIDDDKGYRLISSRKPDDLPAFERELVRAFATA